MLFRLFVPRGYPSAGKEGACQAAFHAIAHFMVQPEGEKGAGHKHHKCGEEVEGVIDEEEEDGRQDGTGGGGKYEEADQKIVLMGVSAMGRQRMREGEESPSQGCLEVAVCTGALTLSPRSCFSSFLIQ